MSDVSIRPHAFVFSSMGSNEGHLSAVFLDPVVSLMFLVGEHGRWCLFLQSGGYGKTAGPGANDDYIVYVVFCLFEYRSHQDRSHFADL
jgi:hypothetical protein